MNKNRIPIPKLSREEYEKRLNREPDKLFKGYWMDLHAHVSICNGDISWQAGALFSLLKMFPDFKEFDGGVGKGVWASNKYLAGHFNISEQTITNALNELRKFGFLMDEGTKNQNSRDKTHRIKICLTHKTSYDPLIRGLMTLIDSIRDSISSFSKEKERECRFATNSSSNSNKVTSVKKRIITKTKPNDISKKINKSQLDLDSEELFNYWNSIDCGPKHKLPNSKIYKASVQLIKTMIQGRWTRLGIDEKWAIKHKVDLKYIHKKHSKESMKRLLDELANFYKTGFWPFDKSKLPKNFPVLIYNEYSGFSWMMSAIQRGVKRTTVITENSAISKLDDLTKEFVDILKASVLQSRNTDELETGEYKRLIEVEDKISEQWLFWENNHPNWDEIKPHYYTSVSRIKDYADWILDRWEGNKEFNVWWIGPGTADWNKYIKNLEKSFELEFPPVSSTNSLI